MSPKLVDVILRVFGSRAQGPDGSLSRPVLMVSDDNALEKLAEKGRVYWQSSDIIIERASQYMAFVRVGALS